MARFLPSWMQPLSQVAFSFGLLSLGLAISSSVAGKLQERFGVKRVTMASGILLGLGFFLTAHSNNLMMLWLSAGGAGRSGGWRGLPADAL